ncbi:MAG: hypothetical protein ACR2IE_17280 [Candidatus Sumerlaeaceae bacterium]
MLVETAELACARLLGVVGEYGNKADRKILDELCMQARESRQVQGQSEMSVDSLRKIADSLKKTKLALEKLRKRQQGDA